MPVGKGLEIKANQLQGSYVIFVGGTGILPYMDFFAYIGRQFIAKNSKESAVFANEDFNVDTSDMTVTIYAYHTDAANAVGYEFMSNLQKVYKKFNGEDKFNYIPQFTRAGHRKLSLEVVNELLSDQKSKSGVNKVWVCGPPPMNNLFYRYKSQIAKNIGIPKFCIDVL